MTRRPYRTWSSYSCQQQPKMESNSDAKERGENIELDKMRSRSENPPNANLNDPPATLSDTPVQDLGFISGRAPAGLDLNKYAAKKNIAQGMLDIALLTANVSQLKVILTVGKQTNHQFYYLAMALVSISIALQCLNGFVYVTLGFLNVSHGHLRAIKALNMISLIVVFLISAVNIVLEPFKVRPAGTMLTIPANPLLTTAFGSLPKMVPSVDFM